MTTDQPLIDQRTDQVNVIAVLQIIWRYKYFIVLVALACGGLAVAVALSTTPIFRAETVVTEARNESMGAAASLSGRFGGLASLAGINVGRSGVGQEARAVLRSRRLAEEFVRRNELVGELAPAAAPTSMWHAVNTLRDTIVSIREDEDRGTTTIAVEWTDPEVAARWANDYVALANELIRTRALNESAENIKYLNEQISKTDVVEIQRVMYDLIENETKTHMLANAREQFAFTVIDPAVAPERRIWPRRTLMVMTGGAIGGTVGVLLALLHSVWSRYRAQRSGTSSRAQRAQA